jgi:hypothetical protein
MGEKSGKWNLLPDTKYIILLSNKKGMKKWFEIEHGENWKKRCHYEQYLEIAGKSSIFVPSFSLNRRKLCIQR